MTSLCARTTVCIALKVILKITMTPCDKEQGGERERRAKVEEVSLGQCSLGLQHTALGPI